MAEHLIYQTSHYDVYHVYDDEIHVRRYDVRPHVSRVMLIAPGYMETLDYVPDVRWNPSQQRVIVSIASVPPLFSREQLFGWWVRTMGPVSSDLEVIEQSIIRHDHSCREWLIETGDVL